MKNVKTPEDEAFDDLARKQGAWGGGFTAKRKMAADKLQEPVHCQCEACINGNIHDSDCSVHSDGDALPFGPCDCRLAALAQPEQEPQYEYLIDDLAEWKQYVEVDSAPYGLREHVTNVLLSHGIKEQSK